MKPLIKLLDCKLCLQHNTVYSVTYNVNMVTHIPETLYVCKACGLYTYPTAEFLTVGQINEFLESISEALIPADTKLISVGYDDDDEINLANE